MASGRIRCLVAHAAEKFRPLETPRLATSGTLPPPQREDLRGLPLARDQSHDAVAPELERGADLLLIGRQIVGASDLVADGMAEARLDDMRRRDAFVVHRG